MRIALSLAGSAILLYSCGKESAAEPSTETLMTEYSENLSLVTSENGRRSYHFETPLLEGYTLAREPYREFRKGIRMTTFRDDSLSTVDVVLTANYAIHYPERDLWEAKGDVVVEKSDGKKLYTQQLFWNSRTKKIYSNVDTKFVQGRNVTIGEGFESDEEFKDWRFRHQKGRIETEFKPRPRQSELSETADAADDAAPAPFGQPATARPAAGEAASKSAAVPPARKPMPLTDPAAAAKPAVGKSAAGKAPDKPAGEPLSGKPSAGPAAGGKSAAGEAASGNAAVSPARKSKPSTDPAAGSKPTSGKAADTEASSVRPTAAVTDPSNADVACPAVRREASRDSVSAARNRPASDAARHKNG